MQVNKLSSTDGFVVVDLPHAPVASGIVRAARKILVDGAENLARATTYSYAAFGMAYSGASAGINADGDGRDDAMRAAVAELAPQAEAGTLVLDAGKGLSPDEIAPWRAGDPRRRDVDLTAALTAGVVAAAAAATGSLDGQRVVIEPAPAANALAQAFVAAGATAEVSLEALGAGTDIVCVGSKVAAVDHEAAAGLGASVLVPFGALPITARGLAVARHRGIRVLADFVTAAGPLLASWDHAAGSADAAIERAAARIAEVVTASAEDGEGDLLGACHVAEAFMSTWCDDLPFGRPLA